MHRARRRYRIEEGPPIPPHYREHAEAVRAHLVHLRGGAPFLSSADAVRLLRWLDAGVPVRAVLAALDRAVISRRRTRARTPLSLASAVPHLGKPPLIEPRWAPEPGDPFGPARRELLALGDPDAARVADALAALPDGPADARVAVAVAVTREAHEARWAALTTEERERRIDAAREELGELAALVDADTLRGLAEEVARESFRATWPRLDTAALAALAGDA